MDVKDYKFDDTPPSSTAAELPEPAPAKKQKCEETQKDKAKKTMLGTPMEAAQAPMKKPAGTQATQKQDDKPTPGKVPPGKVPPGKVTPGKC